MSIARASTPLRLGTFLTMIKISQDSKYSNGRYHANADASNHDPSSPIKAPLRQGYPCPFHPASFSISPGHFYSGRLGRGRSHYCSLDSIFCPLSSSNDYTGSAVSHPTKHQSMQQPWVLHPSSPHHNGMRPPLSSRLTNLPLGV